MEATRLFLTPLLALSFSAHAKLAEWDLIVSMTSYTHPEEHKRWDMTYRKFPQSDACEHMAKQTWQRYYVEYPVELGQLGTYCFATSHGKKWWSIVECRRDGSCEYRRGIDG